MKRNEIKPNAKGALAQKSNKTELESVFLNNCL